MSEASETASPTTSQTAPPAFGTGGGGGGGGDGALRVKIPKNVSFGKAPSGSQSESARTPYLRTPTFLRPLEDDEHEELSALNSGLVQFFNSSCENDWERPWSKDPPSSTTGTGFVIDVERRLIVTNAHVVTDAKTLQARKEGDFDKLEATILAVSHQSDLALVTVSDGSFWTGAVALEIGETPRVQAHVDVLGYPMGGDGISITSGVVSRVDWGEYTQGQESNLIVTVDAAINPGNSGGPAVSSGKVVGVAFQGVDGASNIGYIIPATILKLFLQDFQANGSALKGFAQLPIAIQTMENPAMRSWLGMPAGMSGVLVRTVPALCGMRGVVREKDVITKVDGHPVSNDGRAQYGKGSPMDFRVYVSTKLAGNPLALSLFREGAIVELTVPAERQLDLFPRTWYKDTEYVFFGGAVFIPMARATKDTAFHTLVNSQVEGRKHVHVDQQVVGLSLLLPHSVNLGYKESKFDTQPLLKIDDAEIHCLGDALLATQKAAGQFIVFEFGDHRKMVLDLAAARKATEALMVDHGIAKDASAQVYAAAAKGFLPIAKAAGGGGGGGGAGATA